MKYAGTILILNDEGESVFERELNEDEIVEAILAAVPDGEEGSEEESDEREIPTRSSYGKRPVKHQCCGSKGWKHKKSCSTVSSHSEDRKAEAQTVKASIDEQKILTEREYKTIRQARSEDVRFTSLNYSEENDLPLQHVNYAVMAATYDQYLRYARKT